MADFQGTVDQIVAGSSFESVGNIMVPTRIDTAMATAFYDLVDADGVVYTNGASTSITRMGTSDPNRDRIEVRAFINVPSNIPAAPRGSKFSINWLLDAPEFTSTTSELITIIPLVSDDVGAQDAIELYGGDLDLTAVLGSNAPALLSIYNDNTLIYQLPVTSTSSSHVGYNFKMSVNTIAAAMRPSLEPYMVMWSQGNVKESSRAFILTPSLIDALKEFNTFMNRLKRECRLEELTFRPTDMMAMMKAGGDRFNGTGLYTDFNFTNAKGAIRYWWLVCSQIVALRTRFLEEAESSFDFSGQAVTLNVDITGYLDSLASNLESQLEAQLIPLKRQFHKRGILAGDGSTVSFVARTRGAAGISASPVSGANAASLGVASGRGVVAIRRP